MGQVPKEVTSFIRWTFWFAIVVGALVGLGIGYLLGVK